MSLKIAIKILDPRLREWGLPAYATEASAGMDVRACLDEPKTLFPGETALLPAGFAMHLENAQCVALLLPRSGLGHRYGVVLGNGTGVIDADYQGPVQVSLWNRGKEAYTIQPFDRVAQMLILPVISAVWQEVNDFEPTSRGEGGFGHTGKT